MTEEDTNWTVVTKRIASDSDFFVVCDDDDSEVRVKYKIKRNILENASVEIFDENAYDDQQLKIKDFDVNIVMAFLQIVFHVEVTPDFNFIMGRKYNVAAVMYYGLEQVCHNLAWTRNEDQDDKILHYNIFVMLWRRGLIEEIPFTHTLNSLFKSTYSDNFTQWYYNILQDEQKLLVASQSVRYLNGDDYYTFDLFMQMCRQDKRAIPLNRHMRNSSDSGQLSHRFRYS